MACKRRRATQRAQEHDDAARLGSSPVLWALALSCVGLSVACPAHASGAPYRIDAALPKWVEPQPLPTAGTLDERTRPDVVRLLLDDQERAGGQHERFVHLAHQVTSTAGVHNESELSVTFDPQYERLVLHRLDVIRNGQRRNALSPRILRVVQQEQDLEARIFNGSLTVMALVEDVRVGDIIELAYTIVGDNPALAGHFATGVTLAYDEPVVLRSYRLLWPAARGTLHVKLHGGAAAPEKLRRDQYEVYQWKVTNTVAPDFEEGAPGWYSAEPWVQLSDFASWQEVARWAAPYYRVPEQLSAKLDKLVADTQAKSKDEREVVERLLRFVQDEVRYLGIEVGTSGLVPHAPATVLERRFGDCKDKAFLLVTLLAHAGIKARPALVSTTWLRGLDAMLPSPFVFDHVIAEVQLGASTFWVDGTASLERGPLATRPPPPFERALVIADDTTALATIPEEHLEMPNTVVEERYDVPDNGGLVHLRVETTYRGSAAYGMRQVLASRAPADLEQEYFDFYNDRDGPASIEAPLQTFDDEEQNIVRVVEHYRLENFWQDGGHDFVPWLIERELVAPAAKTRTMPYALAHPLWLRQHIVAKLPEYYDIDDEDESVKTEAFELSSSSHYLNRSLTLDYSFHTLADHVPAKDMAKHTQAIERAHHLAWYGIQNSRAARSSEMPWGASFALGLLFFAGLAAIPVWRRVSAWRGHRRVRRFRKQGEFLAGEAPETAIRVKSAEQALQLLAKQRCRCRTKVMGANCAPSATEMLFGDERLIAYSVACPSCGEDASWYFAVEAS